MFLINKATFDNFPFQAEDIETTLDPATQLKVEMGKAKVCVQHPQGEE